MISSAIRIQLFRYTVVGLLSNFILYLIYILLTWTGIDHKIAMTLLYAIGVTQTFYFNRRWTFGDGDKISQTFIRYISIYIAGYIFNLIALMLLVDHWGWPHQWVQGVMIFIIAGVLFLLQRYWVFHSHQTISL